MGFMDMICFLFLSRKSEQELYEESLLEAEALLRDIDANRPIVESARKRIPQIIRGLHHDGVQVNANLIQRLAEVAADGYIHGSWNERPE